MANPPVLTAVCDGVLTVTMNRPEARNCFTAEICTALTDILRQAETDSAIRAIVLTGAGDHFSAGGDVNALLASLEEPLSEEEQMRSLREAAVPGRLLHEMPKPSIAMIRGFAAGGGISLAAACDFRFAAEDAKLSFGYTGMGLGGDLGGSIYVTRILGPARALEFAMLARYWDAPTARDFGLLTGVHPAENLEAETMAVAKRLAQAAPLGLAAIKKNVATAHAALDVALQNEASNFVRCRNTQDHREAALAFLEKRRPVFVGIAGQ